MGQEIVIHHAIYRPEEKRLEIAVAMVEFQLLETTTTVVDKETGKQVTSVTDVQKKTGHGFGEALFCADAPGHVHDPISCAATNAAYPKIKADLAARFADWKAKPGPVNMTPAPELRKIE